MSELQYKNMMREVNYIAYRHIQEVKQATGCLDMPLKLHPFKEFYELEIPGKVRVNWLGFQTFGYPNPDLGDRVFDLKIFSDDEVIYQQEVPYSTHVFFPFGIAYMNSLFVANATPAMTHLNNIRIVATPKWDTSKADSTFAIDALINCDLYY